ncbi:MAG: 16S rRNA (cytosine(1402)-N(4))-methyltransferase RsmH [Coriobacteriales bacterium]|nr:16S rRNA (cytosine(1402)-N(4))-methyltransferase RsmH [Coriobacteriales bacterium]
MTDEYRHTPVMLPQCREALALQAGETFCDCTLGGAGHALAIAPGLLPKGLLIGIDRDNMALATASARIAQQVPTLAFMPLKGDFAHLDDLLLTAAVPGVDGFLFDLGVSSPQLDIPQRGFSYAHDAPLDMRMDPGTQTLTAAEVINTATKADLTRIIRTYGEERWAPRIASFIVKERERAPIVSTGQLAALIKAAIPQGARRTGGNPAKRTFLALRIVINGELTALQSGLEAALRWLNPGGRIVVISYHSLEDRIVKEVFARMAQGCTCPPEVPVCTCGQEPILATVSRKPAVPTAEEQEANPRSRSAKLRAAVKR